MLQHANHIAGQDRKPGANASAVVVGAEKLLETMLAGSGEPAAPFGLIRDVRRAAKSATLKLERDLASRLRDRAAALNISMESLVCLAWSLVLARFCGQDSVTFGAALPPFTKAVPVRIDAATRPAETAVRETYELLTQIRTFLPVWGALLPERPWRRIFLASAVRIRPARRSRLGWGVVRWRVAAGSHRRRAGRNASDFSLGARSG